MGPHPAYGRPRPTHEPDGTIVYRYSTNRTYAARLRLIRPGAILLPSGRVSWPC